MEAWRLAHPEFGVVEVHFAPVEELRELDPDWPEEDTGQDGDEHEDAGEGPEGGAAESEAPEEGYSGTITEEPRDGIRGRLDAVVQRWEAAKDRGVLVSVDGVPRARMKSVSSTVIDIDRDLKPGKYSPGVAKRNGAHLKVSANTLEEIREITFRDGKDVVIFDPPAGSPAERRYRAMEESPWKRIVYPISAGMGKVGWAIAVLILLPFIQRLVSWLLGLFPDIDWPEIPWPDINLPQINLPSIPWPDINWPDITLPGWVLWMLDNTKLWVPIVIGVVVGIMAVRTARKSRRTRQKWSTGDAEKGTEKDGENEGEEDGGGTKAQD
ncbi:hypothetical protein [Corynebacterium halotolerans]|uniref:Uncharacterized protein n=1 Tax=Corynebacterium halotolerans YIM 70093 = DSM 44683 TaxID=1121362 RepID=M1NWD3_9CORY|nr:hypothetical protein [Corynebacterium halotolerans]AGF71805.1 hypothetical protein A605_03970 [Corynebacterium halotolerans YIM 70093 = DSM 44683]